MTKLSGWLRHCVGLYRDEDMAVLNTKLIRQTMREGEKIPYTEVRRARFENYSTDEPTTHITFDLANDTYKPYRKLNDESL